ncbi:glutamate 2,3-aminomutase [Natranaerobius thermophilus]|uniref:L-lysine 2,3-aminomutase n=1 Tax=Natranaerobius thermophilus (strain ATCC BAA-1301 / DSM 18059 / JW/NM-WN-LF) TaxID=457570 RepID=B2A5I5_NATTJ|nr:glutamate 2,3-aminomutase [Natranaerobius thermophilus]ACB85340.1 L-lysine 2,3-aminomutase [Natranaerobius thermophilus JW/NM-WN-LF]
MSKDARTISNKRAQELKDSIQDFLEAREHIVTGEKISDELARRRSLILELFNASEQDWSDWKWQLQNRISDVETLEKILNLTESERQEIEQVGKDYRWAVSPYYASLMDPDDPECPVRKQSIPSAQEVKDKAGVTDPMAEEFTNPAGNVTRRYPDRLIINVTNQCAMYCRHCQRKRNIGEVDKPTPKDVLEESIEYVKNHAEIRDVLLTGGDAFMLSDETLDWLLTELRKIPHVEIIRLGSRTPVTMPQRITQNLCDILTKHLPLYVNTQYNHPKELTAEAKKATFKLARAGVGLGNQAVLLNTINNDPHVMKTLCHELLKGMVRPYYIFHAKKVKGTTHFNTRVEDGLEILEKMRGYTSGMAIPSYIINAPDGHGKTPIVPEYMISQGRDKVYIRTWENRVFEYPNDAPEQ